MTQQEIIEGLESLMDDRKTYFNTYGDDEIFRYDYAVLEAAKELIQPKGRRRYGAIMKTDKTRCLEMEIWNATNKQGVFGCFEVTIGWNGKERVDYMTYDTKGSFRCYEIKVTKSDFHSACHNSFVGHLNYYVLPLELYEAVKDEIPEWVGVYVSHTGRTYSVKKARRRPVKDPDMLKDSMIRSLFREVAKQVQSGDTSKIERKNREISQLRKERDTYYRQYWDLLREVQSLYGTRWNKTEREDLQ